MQNNNNTAKGKLKINTNTKNTHKNRRYRPYVLADAGYDSEETRDLLENKHYIVLIPNNPKNTNFSTFASWAASIRLD